MRERKIDSGNKARMLNREGKGQPSRAQNQGRAQLTKAPTMGCVWLAKVHSGGLADWVRRLVVRSQRLSLHMSNLWSPTKLWQSWQLSATTNYRLFWGLLIGRGPFYYTTAGRGTWKCLTWSKWTQRIFLDPAEIVWTCCVWGNRRETI